MAEIKINLGIGNKDQLKRELQGVFKDATKVNTKGMFDNLFKGMFGDITGASQKKGDKSEMQKIGSALGRAGVIAMALGAIGKGVNKMINILAESSASLKATVLLGRQAFRIFMKPFGDALSTIFRPAMMWLLKFAVAWNNAFANGNTGAEALGKGVDSLLNNNLLQNGADSPDAETTPIAGLKKLWEAIDWEALGKSMTDWGKKIGKAITDAGTWISTKLSDFGTWIGNKVLDASNAVSDFFTAVKDWVNNMLIKLGLKKKPEDNTTTQGTSPDAWRNVPLQQGVIDKIYPYDQFKQGTSSQNNTAVNINVTGNTISNPADVQNLASAIKDQMRRELRTRTSYGAF